MSSLTEGRLKDGTTPNTAILKAIKNIFYQDKIGGNFTVDIIGNKIIDVKVGMDDHHIYPKSKVSAFHAKIKFNSIANIVSIDSTFNRIDIKDKKPSEYFYMIEDKDNAKFNCEQNLIDINLAKRINSEELADSFICKRAEKMASIINEHF